MKIARRTEAPEVSLRQWLKSQPVGRKHRIIEYLGYLCMTILMVLMASIIVYIYTIAVGDDREEYARFVAELSRFREASGPLPA